MSTPATPADGETKDRSGDGYLRVYLADHHAGACGGLELARRIRSNNEGHELGAVVRDQIAPAIEEDLANLEEVMDRLGISPQWWKDAAAWAVEKAGRLKLNGQLTGYSPLSRLSELEALALAVAGKRFLWESLKQVQHDDPRLAGFEFDDLIRRADEQRAIIDQHRARAAGTTFA